MLLPFIIDLSFGSSCFLSIHNLILMPSRQTSSFLFIFSQIFNCISFWQYVRIRISRQLWIYFFFQFLLSNQRTLFLFEPFIICLTAIYCIIYARELFSCLKITFFIGINVKWICFWWNLNVTLGRHWWKLRRSAQLERGRLQWLEWDVRKWTRFIYVATVTHWWFVVYTR